MPSLEQVRVHNQMTDEAEQTRLAREAQVRAQMTEADRARTQQQSEMQRQAAEQQNAYQRAAAEQQAGFQAEAQQRQNQFTAGRDYTGVQNQSVAAQQQHGFQTERDATQQQHTVFNDWNRENIARASAEQHHGMNLEQQYRGAQYQQVRDAQGYLYQGALAEQHGEIQARLSQVQLGQQEEMRLQRLRQARSSVMANPNLSDEERNHLVMQIDTGISPLENRAREAGIMQTHVQTAAAFQQATIQGQVFAQHQRWLARGAQGNLQTLTDPNTGERGLFGVGPDGQLTRMDFGQQNEMFRMQRDIHADRRESHRLTMETGQAQLQHLWQAIQANPQDIELRQTHARLANQLARLHIDQSPQLFQANMANMSANTGATLQNTVHHGLLFPGQMEAQNLANRTTAATLQYIPDRLAAEIGMTRAQTLQINQAIQHRDELQPGHADRLHWENEIHRLTANHMPALNRANLANITANTNRTVQGTEQGAQLFPAQLGLANANVAHTNAATELMGTQTANAQRLQAIRALPMAQRQMTWPGPNGTTISGFLDDDGHLQIMGTGHNAVNPGGGAGGHGGGAGGGLPRGQTQPYPDGHRPGADLSADTVQHIQRLAQEANPNPEGAPNFRPPTPGSPAAADHAARMADRERRITAQVARDIAQIQGALHPPQQNAEPHTLPSAPAATNSHIALATQRATAEVDAELRGGTRLPTTEGQTPAEARTAEIERRARNILGSMGVVHPEQTRLRTAMAEHLAPLIEHHDRASNTHNNYLDWIARTSNITFDQAYRAATDSTGELGQVHRRNREAVNAARPQAVAARTILALLRTAPMSHWTPTQQRMYNEALIQLPEEVRNRLRADPGSGGGDY